MSCALTTFAACFKLSGIFIDTGVAAQDNGVEHFEHIRSEQLVRTPEGAMLESSASDVRTFSHQAQNMYGYLAVGYELEMSSSLSFVLRLQHDSSIATGRDRGVNSIRFGLRWRPWGDSL